MFESIKDFVSRNRKKISIVGITIGGTYLVGHYVKQRVIEWQEVSAREYFEKARRIQHFESTERTCNEAIISLTASVNDEIVTNLNTDTILEKLRSRNVENKLELWENLKIVAFTRMTTLIYATTILVITLRVQMNILGGYLYKDTTVPETKKISREIQQSYLSLVQDFLRSGYIHLAKLIEGKVSMVLESYSFKKKLNLSDIEQIFWAIQLAINSDSMEPNTNLARYAFPEKFDNSNYFLENMYNATLDVLESDEVIVLSTNSVSRAFSVAIDYIAEYFTDSVTESETFEQCNGQNNISTLDMRIPEVANINKITIPLAKLIPILSEITASSGNMIDNKVNLASSLVSLFLTSEKIKTLGTNVYEVFSV